jgi:hypothetical protein
VSDWDRYERDRDLWRAQDAQYDRDVAYRDQTEASERGWRALAQGDTAEAIRSVAGPEAALHFLEGVADHSADDGWPLHHYAVDLDEFLENMQALPWGYEVRVRATQVGTVEIEAIGAALGAFSAPVAVAWEYLNHMEEIVLSEHSERVVRALRSALTQP